MRKPDITVIENKMLGSINVAWKDGTPYLSIADVCNMIVPGSKPSNAGRVIDKSYIERVSDSKGTGGSKIYATPAGVKQFIKSKTGRNKINASMVQTYVFTHVLPNLSPPRRKAAIPDLLAPEANGGDSNIKKIYALTRKLKDVSALVVEINERLIKLEASHVIPSEPTTKPTDDKGDFDA